MNENQDYRLIPAFDNNGKEIGFYTREPDGVSGMTVSALSGFCGLSGGSTSAISKLLEKIENSNPETNDLSEPLKPYAGKTLRLETNDSQGRLVVPDDACYAIAEHYVFEAREYPGKPIAIENYREVGRAGMRVYIWSQTGYIPELLRQSLRSHTTTYIERLENIRDHRVADDLWTTFRESSEVLLLVEKEMGVPVDQLDLCDGSIGSHWSKYREGQPWQVESGNYIHRFRDQRGDIECRAYSLGELSYFRRWLREVYIPQHLPKYLADKYGKLAVREIYESMQAVTPEVEAATKIKRMTPKQQESYESYQRLKQRLMKVQEEERAISRREKEQLNLLPDQEDDDLLS